LAGGTLFFPNRHPGPGGLKQRLICREGWETMLGARKKVTSYNLIDPLFINPDNI
jgi:hypothetical protein